MKSHKLILLILILFLISGCYKNQEESPKVNNRNLPESFTINFYSYGSSGGGDRTYSATLSFMDNKILSGSSHYTFAGADLTKDITCSFNVEQSLWIEEGTNDVCQSYYYLDLSVFKNELENQINSLGYKHLPKDQCPIFSVCYQF